MDANTVSLLELKNAEWASDARLAMISLPVPMTGRLPAGFAGVATQTQDVACWPDSQSGRRRAPRRRLMFGMSENALPGNLRLGRPSAAPRGTQAVRASLRVVEEDLTRMLPYKFDEVVFRWKNRSLALRLGIRWKNAYHWWQWLRLETLWAGPLVTAIRVGGFIEVTPVQAREFQSRHTFVGSKRLHCHDWLFAEVFALCFANGVVQVTARHVNNHRFDEGRELQHLTPVLGLVPDRPARLNETLRGYNTRFTVGSAALNLDDAAPLVSAEHPGSLRTEAGVVVYQPYEGVEVEGGTFRGGRKDGFRVRAGERTIPKGVARTVRFSFGLGDAVPVVSRLVAPEWWYASCGELWPGAVLPVRDDKDARIDKTYHACSEDHRGRFDEHIMGQAWEGESPYASLLYYYRSAQPEHWRRAIRDAYHIADIAFDHSTETIRMTGYPFDGSIAQPLFRTVGLTFGYLETGDPYLLECSESAATHWYWIDRHNWPRYAFGRDGASIRSLIFLWDYTGKEDYRTMAREAIGRLIQCQNPDGSYFDQGGTTGVHCIGQVVKKPWMACLATDPILDYLLRGHPDAELWRAVEKTGGFLMRAFQRGKKADYWPYQVSYGDGHYDPWIHYRQPESKGRLPTRAPFAHGHKARLMNVLTRRTGEEKYLATWLRFYDKHWAGKEPGKGDYHTFNKTLQHLPFAQAHGWNARWKNGSLHIDPLLLPAQTEMHGTIVTPAGHVTLTVRRKGRRLVITERTGADMPVQIAT